LICTDRFARSAVGKAAMRTIRASGFRNMGGGYETGPAAGDRGFSDATPLA
jgi:hypothetical protein